MIAFAFPGQGVQRPGLGRPWTRHPSWALVEQCAAGCGLDLERLLTADLPRGVVAATENAQPAVLVASLLAHDALVAAGVRPDLCVGHSLGEVTALAAAGVLDAAVVARLVGDRGRAMADAAAEVDGAMTAVSGLSAAEVSRCCTDPARVWVATDNAPEQVAIAGHRTHVDRTARICSSRGARTVVPLDVAGAFHTPMMRPAVDRLAPVVAALPSSEPLVPVLSAVDAQLHAERSGWQERVLAQLVEPVRWREASETAVDAGLTTVVEIGPGHVLRNLLRRRWPQLRVLSVATPDDVVAVAEALRPVQAG